MKAGVLDKKANIFKVQSLSGKCARICGGYKREGKCALPGEAPPEQRRGVSRGHSSPGEESGRRAERKKEKFKGL